MTEDKALKILNALPDKRGEFISIDYNGDQLNVICNIESPWCRGAISEVEIMVCQISEYPNNCGALILHNFDEYFTSYEDKKSTQLGYETVLKHLFSRNSDVPNIVYYASDIVGPYNRALKKTMNLMLSRKNPNSGNIVYHYIQTKKQEVTL